MNTEDDNKNDAIHEFRSIDALMQFVAGRVATAGKIKSAGEKVASKAMLTLDGATQKLRLKLTAMVEDPSHRLTERGFSHAMGAMSTACEAILSALKNTQPLTDPLILRAVIEYLTFVAGEMEAAPCQCDNCQ